MKNIVVLLVFSGLLFVSCSDDDSSTTQGPEEPTPANYTSGNADFSKYVSVGNSLTAGYSDGALFIDGQNASFPNMLAQSFSKAGGGAFTLPLMADNLGGLSLGGQPLEGFENRFILSFASGSPTPVRLEGVGSTDVSTVLSGPFNNMGIPGAKSYELLAPGYGSPVALAQQMANPYYVRIASSPNASVIGDAASQNATFFTLWAGNNDILLYATNGGAGVDQTGNINPSTYGRNDITDPNVLAASLNGMLQALTANGADGAIANLPDITTIPYFTTVPFAPLDPTNPEFGPQIPLLNATFAQLNGVFAFLGVPERSITFSETGPSAVIIKDESLVDLSNQITQTLLGAGADAGQAVIIGLLYGQARQANENDLIVLPASSQIAQLNIDAFATLQGLGLPATDAGQLSVNGITYPLEDQWVLTPDEQQSVETALTAYNQTIEALAIQYDLAFVDANALLNTVAEQGIPLSDGSTVTATFATGGGFSLDGVHPSPRGYAIIANRFIEAIEQKYNAELPRLDPLNYTGLYIK